MTKDGRLFSVLRVCPRFSTCDRNVGELGYVSFHPRPCSKELTLPKGYYRYLNAHGKGVAGVAFLIVTAILDAGRNALSFFLLLVVALGWSVVREELPSMTRCKTLAIAHFVFGGAKALIESPFEICSIFWF